MGFMETVKGWFGMAKEQTKAAAEKAAPYVDKAKEAAAGAAEKAAPYVDKAKEAAAGAAEKAAPYVDKAKEAAQDAYASAKERMGGNGSEAEMATDEVADTSETASGLAASEEE